MILICSVGRSGTSVLTQILAESGLKVGSDKWYKPINAGFENRETIQINNRLLSHLVKGEEINLFRVYADIVDLNYDLVKDPQFLTDHRIIKHWHKARKDIQIIFLYRRP